MEKTYIAIGKAMPKVMMVLGIIAIIQGTVYWLWHLWMVGGMLISLSRTMRKEDEHESV